MQLMKGVDQSSGKRALKNLSVLGLCFMLVFTAFVSLQSLQSTLNPEAGVGVVSLACVYAATVLSCLFAPAAIKRLSIKCTMMCAFALFLLYIAVNFYPKDFLLVPASLLLGLLTGPLWSAQATYVMSLAMHYSHVNEAINELILNRFTSIFMGIYQTSQVWGHIISIVVLDVYDAETANVTFHEPSVSDNWHGVPPGYVPVIADTAYATHNTTLCGTHACGALELRAPDKPQAQVTKWIRVTLLTIQLATASLGLILMWLGLDKNHVNAADLRHSLSLTSHELIFATLRILREPCLLLLLPLVVFIGLEQGFIFGDYTKVGFHRITVYL